MSWIDTWWNITWNIAWWFYDLYEYTRGWVMPFRLVSDMFYGLYDAFYSLLTPISHFYDWAYEIWRKVRDILDFSDIYDFFEQWFDWARDAWDWVAHAVLNIWNVIDDWWDGTLLYVKGLIDTAKDALNTIINQVKLSLAGLQSAWDNFVNNILPDLASWTGIAQLIDSTLRRWFPFYDELVSLWGEIREFFMDPPQYVYDKLDEFFERFF